ncbi:uncharacterized protein [Miscanthus floridulus]|uniref:uncharacterized protein n=1 Tax=Miscanthus floridulus TaxID=154761 RepID=UPI00345A9C51
MVLDRLRSFSAMFSTHPFVELCYYYVSPEAEEQNQVSGAGAGAAPDRQLAVPEPASSVAAISMMSRNVEDETAAGAVKSMVSSDGDGTCALGQEGRHAQEPMPSPPPPPAAPAAVAVVTEETARVAALVRGPPEEEPATVAEFVKRKHRRGYRVYAVEGKAELNARAEQFIRQFRQELKLQRLDSMLSRHAHTLSTGSGAPTSLELQSGCSI